MRLPELPNRIRRRQAENVAITGINFSDDYREGDFSESLNLSTRRYPYISTRLDRLADESTDESNKDMTVWDGKVLVIRGGETMDEVYYDGNLIGTLSMKEMGARTFVPINSRLVIWPDKAMVRATESGYEIVHMDASLSGTVAPQGASVTIEAEKITIPTQLGDDLTEKFGRDDAIFITGLTEFGVLDDVAYILNDVTETELIFTGTQFTEGTFSEGSFSVERRVPDMDYICEAENRIWGCSSAEKTIYASALGDPTNFYDYTGDIGSYAVAVGTEGNFTGCCKLSSTVLFFKENCVHKILGGVPSLYELYTYEIDGVKEGCSKSIVNYNNTIFYMGGRGVFAYSGGTASFISSRLGEIDWKDAIAGTDNRSLFICARDGATYRLLTFDYAKNIWLEVEQRRIVAFSRSGNECYMLYTDGTVAIDGKGGESDDLEWKMKFKRAYATSTGSYNRETIAFTAKKYQRLIIRCEVSGDAIVEVSTDGGRFKEIGRLVKTEGRQVMVIPINRCDYFELYIHGHGQFTLLNFEKQYRMGSER